MTRDKISERMIVLSKINSDEKYINKALNIPKSVLAKAMTQASFGLGYLNFSKIFKIKEKEFNELFEIITGDKPTRNIVDIATNLWDKRGYKEISLNNFCHSLLLLGSFINQINAQALKCALCPLDPSECGVLDNKKDDSCNNLYI